MSIFDSREERSRRDPRLVQTAEASAPSGTGTPPAISAISSGTPGATTATITWTTDLPSNSQVFWGTTTAYTGATSPVIDPAVVTSHSVAITGLITLTVYHYKVRSRNPVGQGTQDSADQTFTTA